MPVITSYHDWRLLHNVTHGHCPCGCEHPQPFAHNDTLYCAACFYAGATEQEGVPMLCEMIPCTPETCRDAQQEAQQEGQGCH